MISNLSDKMIGLYEQNAKNLSSVEKNKINDIKEIKKLANEFESIFTELMLKSMRSSVQKGGLVDGGNGEDIFKGMLDTEYAKAMAEQRSSGIADSIESHLLQAYDPSLYRKAVVQKSTGINAYNKSN